MMRWRTDDDAYARALVGWQVRPACGASTRMHFTVHWHLWDGKCDRRGAMLVASRARCCAAGRGMGFGGLRPFAPSLWVWPVVDFVVDFGSAHLHTGSVCV